MTTPLINTAAGPRKVVSAPLVSVSSEVLDSLRDPTPDEDDPAAKKKEQPLLKQPLETNASVWASTLNLINNVVGAGVFSMPWAMRRTSVVPGVLLCIFTCLVNSICYYILARCCEMSGSYTFLEIGVRCFGERFGVVAQLCVFVYTLGSCVSFAVLVGDFLAGETGAIGGPRPVVVYTIAALVFFPLSLLRNTESLKWSSLVSFFASLGAAALVVGTAVLRPPDAFTSPAVQRGDVTVHFFRATPDFWAAVPVMNVAFTAHYNAPRFYLELKDRTPKRFALVVALAMTFAMCIYAAVGVCGYYTFGEDTRGSILMNYAPSWRVAVFARVLLAVVVVFTFPLANHAVRDSAFGLCSRGQMSTNTAPSNIYVAVTALLVSSTTIAGVYLVHIESILAIKGALLGTVVVYLLPLMMYAQLVSEQQYSQATSIRPGRLLRGMGLLFLLPLWGFMTCGLSLHSLLG